MFVCISHPVSNGFLHLICNDVISAAIQTASPLAPCRFVNLSEHIGLGVCVPVTVWGEVAMFVRAKHQEPSLCAICSLQQCLNEHL